MQVFLPESVYRARDIFQVRRMVIVTQEYHLSRALYIARATGDRKPGVCLPIPEPTAVRPPEDLREILARDKDFLTCILKPKPTYLESYPGERQWEFDQQWKFGVSFSSVV